MTSLPIISAKEMLALLQRQGFEVSRVHGSHYLLRHTDGRRTAVPVHSGIDIGLVLLLRILKQAEISPDEYRALVNQH
jgi:predicted RNA binding protein YcfA (HicA-like mRNA interferase family)